MYNINQSRPFQKILDRDEPASLVQEHLSESTQLREVVDYGTHLVPRCYKSSPGGLTEAVVLGVLLKHFLAMVDGVEVLITNGAVLAAHTQSRVLFETHMYIAWILRENSEQRSKQYHVW